MKSNKAFKFRIYPDTSQRICFAKTFGCVRFIYNRILADRNDHYEKTGKILYKTPASYKKDFPWLKEVDSLALCNAQLNIKAAFKNFFTNPEKFKFPRFKSKKDTRRSYTTNCVNNNIRIEDGFIILPKVGKAKIKQHRVIPDNYKLKAVTVSQSSSGKYYASVLFEYESQVSKMRPRSFIGLDYSMKELYRDSDGNEPSYPRFYRKAEKRLAREQRKLSLMVKGSNNRLKQRIKVAIAHEKVASQRKDFLHKLSNQLAVSNDCVCIEDLNMQAMSKTLKFGKSVSDNGWGMFTTFLRYKLEDNGKQLVRVDKFFASSQTCHCCGYKNTETKDLSVREWICHNCGTHHDRDVNAAINIRNEGMRLLGVVLNI